MPSLYGFEIDSDLPLERCRPAPAPRGVLRVRRVERDLLAREGELIAWDEEGGAATLLATAGEAVLFWCSLTGAYAVHGARGEVEVQPSGERTHWEHRLTATVLPLLLAERGDLALHAAAVQADDGAVVFCGQRGAGKSTLAAGLSLAGYPLLAEDGVVVSGLGEAERPPVVWPGPDGVRVPNETLAVLCGAAPSPVVGSAAERVAGDKATHLVGGGPIALAELRTLVLLGPRGGSAPALRPVPPVDALTALVPHALFRGHDGLEEAMTRCARLVTDVPVLAATLPDELPVAAGHAERLLEMVESFRARREPMLG